MASNFGEPQSRNEAILQNILGADNELLPPESRIEALLQAILEQGAMGGSTKKFQLVETIEVTESGVSSIERAGYDLEVSTATMYKLVHSDKIYDDCLWRYAQ